MLISGDVLVYVKNISLVTQLYREQFIWDMFDHLSYCHDLEQSDFHLVSALADFGRTWPQAQENIGPHKVRNSGSLKGKIGVSRGI